MPRRILSLSKLPLVWSGGVLGVLLLSSLFMPAAAADAVPLPTVEGPLPAPVTEGIRVWGGLGRFGYTVAEYLVSGRANVYQPVSMADARRMMDRDNVKDLARHDRYVAQLRRANAPYTTRILVYRPEDPAKFSGEVVAEITHPGGGGRALVFGMVNGALLSHGDAYVTIEHPLTFHGMKIADPARYGRLQAADATQIWGMVAQVGALLRSDSSKSPLRGYRVRNLFLTGYSFTGVATATFADYYHDDARMQNGAPIFDGYLPFANAMYVKPLDVPVIRLNTQSDFNSFGGVANRRQDSDAAGDRYRLYEVAGASHANASPVPLPEAAPPRPIKLQEDPGLPKFAPQKCLRDMPHGSRPDTMPINYAIAQAFLDMYRWVNGGTPPPRTPFIATGRDGQALLDANGNAIGGLRLPAMIAPAAAYGTGRGDCFLFGYQLPFATEKMKARYGTHANYMRSVERAAREDAARRLISAAAARAIVAQAGAAPSF